MSTEREIIKRLSESHKLDEAIPAEFRRSLKEMLEDLKNVAEACDMFEEGFATKELNQIKAYCNHAMNLIRIINR